MPPARLRAAYVLSTIIVALVIVASAGGLLIGGLYRDNIGVSQGWKGNDLVTLIIAVPLLLMALGLARRGSWRGHLVWLGMLDYTLYNYAFYLFGAAYNRLFLVYVAVFALSILALIFGLAGSEVEAISRRFSVRAPVKWVSGYMLLVAVALSAVHIGQTVGFVATGDLPPIIVATQHPTNVVAALDLSLMVPFLVLGTLWLWNRRPWGYVVAVMLNVKGAVYTLVLAVASAFAARAGVVNASAEIPLWETLAAASLLATLLLLLGSSPSGTERPR